MVLELQSPSEEVSLKELPIDNLDSDVGIILDDRQLSFIRFCNNDYDRKVTQ